MATTYLEDLRYRSGLTIQQVLDGVRERAPDAAPVARSGVNNWEKQGIRDVRVLRALADIYGSPLDEVVAAAEASKARYHQLGRSVRLQKKVAS